MRIAVVRLEGAGAGGKHVCLTVISSFCSGRGGVSHSGAVRSLKCLSILRGRCSSPVARFRGEVRRLGGRGRRGATPVRFAFCSSSQLYPKSSLQGGFNCTTLDRVCRRLNVRAFLTGQRHRSGRRCSTGTVVGVLICSQLLFPTSGESSCSNERHFFRGASCSLSSACHYLSFLGGRGRGVRI